MKDVLYNHLPLTMKCPRSLPRDKHVNGLVGRVKRKKFSLLLYGKLERIFRRSLVVYRVKTRIRLDIIIIDSCMNKLLGPDFRLDAKNSKDANAAMLRWWSLLDKYSCKASKLHLKPRRFKIFIEALEHQLLKDRKKNVKRPRLSQGENCPSLCPTPFLLQNKASMNETRSVKFVLVDSQNIQNAGSGKGSAIKRSPNSGVSKISNKGDSSPTKASRQRRRTGSTVSAAAIKKWEKAAIAGVSLVADAAEHSELTTCGEEPRTYSALAHSSLQPVASSRGESRPGSSIMLPPFPNISSNHPPQSSVENIGKLKLQLFPIDDGTKRALEMDKHNPYLELTLSTRKKITSVMEHLHRKWGNCPVACGELMLFPDGAQRENVLKCQRWTRESFDTAADAYAMIGKPPVFRLRYGWISAGELEFATSTAPSGISDKPVTHEYSQKNLVVDSTPTLEPWSYKFGNATPGKDKQALSSHCNTVLQSKNDSLNGSRLENDLLDQCDFRENMLGGKTLACRGSEKKGVSNSSAMAAVEWADSLTNISVGDLLTEVSDEDADCVEAPLTGSSPYLGDIPFSCDSFDAAIAAHILTHQNKMGLQSTGTSHSSSIFDAEETCDAFSFRNRSFNNKHTQSSSAPVSSPVCKDIIRTNSTRSDKFAEGSHKEEEMMDAAVEEDLMDEGPSEPNFPEASSEPNFPEASSKDFNTLANMYWPESLGPLDLDAPTCRYISQDITLSDNLGGLSRLIANSADAFQHCQFFSVGKKEASSATKAEGITDGGSRKG